MEAGGLPNPTAATLWGPESVPHIPSAGTMWSLRPTGRVFSDQAHTGSPRAVMEGPQPPASDRPEDGSHSCLPLGTPDPGPPLGAVRAQTPGVGDPRPRTTAGGCPCRDPRGGGPQILADVRACRAAYPVPADQPGPRQPSWASTKLLFGLYVSVLCPCRACDSIFLFC